jgi:hypothetical protein
MKALSRTLAAALLSSAAAVSPAFAADHREAPEVDKRPQADLNDIYVFRAPGNRSRLVLVMTVNPAAAPGFNASYFFDEDALYRFEIDTRGDVSPEHVIDIAFTPIVPGPQNFRVTLDGRTLIEGPATRPSVLNPAPPERIITRNGPVTAFAGLSDDPFFFDAIGFSRVVNGTGGFRGVDSFGGLNVSSIVLEFPVSLVSDGQTRFEVSGYTYLRSDAFVGPPGASTVRVGGTTFEQIDRTAQPAVATAFIPFGLRDQFNSARPEDDAQFADEILASLQTFGTSAANVRTLASLAVPDTLKFDLRQPDGYPNGRRLQDDVIDTLLSLVFNRPTGDGVDSNDRPFLRRFPYVGEPQTQRERPRGDS